ncbi:MAG: U32 family peptidase, partial [Clostridia bacterium]|nr:U32 family peptidase [Clostridia bacterium]
MLELLLPAGNLKKLRTAFHFGADAVYVGGKSLSLRAYADNFTREELEEGIAYAHSLGKKVYVTANIFARNADLEAAGEYFAFLEKAHADAVLISDAGLLALCKEKAPSLTIHLSTQANTTNALAVKFWQSIGVKRVVLARELGLKDISEIHAAVPAMELEAF